VMGNNLRSRRCESAVDHLGTDTNGNATVTLRNPWGTVGAGSNGKDDGNVTMTVQQAFAKTVGAVIGNA
jgi:hypothetical protein